MNIWATLPVSPQRFCLQCYMIGCFDLFKNVIFDFVSVRGLSVCGPGKRGKCRNSHFFTRSHGQVSGHSRINYPIYKSLCFFFFLHQAENTKQPRFKTSSTIRIILIFHLKNTSKRRTEKILERHGKKVFDSSKCLFKVHLWSSFKYSSINLEENKNNWNLILCDHSLY